MLDPFGFWIWSFYFDRILFHCLATCKGCLGKFLYVICSRVYEIMV